MELTFHIRGRAVDLRMLEVDDVRELRRRLDVPSLSESLLAFDSYPIASGHVKIPDAEVNEFHVAMRAWHDTLDPGGTRSQVRETIWNLVEASEPSMGTER